MSKPKILIIDDDPDIVEAMRMPLEANAYHVISAGSGREGLKKVKEEMPDLIILDVMMETDTEGFHVAYKLRDQSPEAEYKDFRHIPILVITAIHQKTALRFSPKTDEEFLPVNDFIEKPIQPKDLLGKVSKLLKR